MKSFVKASIVLLLFSIVGYFFASPYIALNNIKNAVQADNSKAISAYIDYPSVRESVKEQVNKQMATKARNTAGKVGAFGALLASNLVNNVVDSYVTPDSMHMLFKGKTLFKNADNNQAEQKASNTEKDNENDVEYDLGYTSLNRFKVAIGKKGFDSKIIMIMHRDGFSWKIKEITLPLNNTAQ